ncbi:MAG: hypothetical protein ACJAVR_003155 [Paracoccaceae bacterium]|jgi:hypothetical protein
MISYGLLGLLPIAWILLQQALIWLMRRTGALDRPPPEIEGRRSFRRHPAVFLSAALAFSAVAADMLFSDWLVFGLVYAVFGTQSFLLLFGQRYVLSDDHLTLEILGLRLRHIALSDIVRLRPGGFWRAQTLVRQAGKEFPLPADMMGVTWLIDRVAPHNDPAIAGAQHR